MQVRGSFCKKAAALHGGGLRFLLVEAAQSASRLDPGLRRGYRRLAFRKGHALAKVAVAREGKTEREILERVDQFFESILRHPVPVT